MDKPTLKQAQALYYQLEAREGFRTLVAALQKQLMVGTDFSLQVLQAAFIDAVWLVLNCDHRYYTEE